MPPPSHHDSSLPDGDDPAGNETAGDDALERGPSETGQPAMSGTHGERGLPTRSALLAAVVGGLLLVALVLVVTQREPVQLPPDSPEATVQAFLQSIVDGTPDTSLLASDACGGGLDTHVRDDDRIRATILDATTDGDVAEVIVSITEFYGAGVFDDGHQHDETYHLERSDEEWRITGFEWPFDRCWNDLGTDLPAGSGAGPDATGSTSPGATVPGTADSGTVDSGSTDSGSKDSGTTDSGSTDIAPSNDDADGEVDA